MTAAPDPAVRRTPFPTRLFLVVVAVCVLAGLIVLPCTIQVRDDQGWLLSRNCLKQISLAFRSYHEAFGRLPPAVVCGKDGRPLYSWRVPLLPFLEEENIYKKFRLDEPWDGPHNQKFLERTPPCYRPSLGGKDPPGLTRYQVFIGPGTAFERDRLTWDDFPDCLAETLLVVEAGEPVPWSKPADLAYDPNGPLPPLGGVYGKPVHVLCYEVRRRPGFNACFADGSARFILSTTDEKTIRALITRNGGEKVSLPGLE
jgi:hypothetical protein